MTHAKQHILVMMLGHPGSGKSYFTRQLAPTLQAVRFNGDHMRVGMFKDPRLATRDDNPKVFGAIEYAVEEVLKAGHSVVYDAQHNQHVHRKRLEELAAKHGAEAVIVWIKTPVEVALKRGVEREELPDQRRKSEEQMKTSIEFFMDALETPGSDERVIEIDGTIPFEQQLKSFNEQLAAFNKV